MTNIQRIGVLTGGGDCPGLNAVLRAVTKSAIFQHDIRVFGIEDGFQGLAENRVSELTSFHVSNLLTRGGTILGSNNRYNPSKVHVGTDGNGDPVYADKIPDCLETIRRHDLDAIIVIGGDGTMSCAATLVEAGVRCIGVPKTIDNDLVGTDITFGFLTAVDTATRALDRLHSTAESHHRVMVCELMGRNAGWISLYAGIASGADVILMPEIPFDLDVITDFCLSRTFRGRGFSIIACAEGAKPRDGEQIVDRVDPTSPDPIRLGGVGKFVSDEIQKHSGLDSRTTVLGHVQRGGCPIAADRVLATEFGYQALQLLLAGGSGRMVVRREGKLDDVDILFAANKQRVVTPDEPLVAAARAVRTCFGDVRPVRSSTPSRGIENWARV